MSKVSIVCGGNFTNCERIDDDPPDPSLWSSDPDLRRIVFRGLVAAVTKYGGAYGSHARRILDELQRAVEARPSTAPQGTKPKQGERG